MLDVAGILFSGLMMLFIIYRAVQLDRTRPWFEAAQPETEEAAVRPGRSPTRPPPKGPVRPRTPRR